MRPHVLALGLGLSLFATAGTEASEEGTRSKAVLEVLQTAIHGTPSPGLNSRDLLHTAIVSTRVPAAGRRLHLPQLPPGCGLTLYSELDVGSATLLLRHLFATYGYVAKPGHEVEVPGGHLALDGLDEKAKVGFVLLSAPDASLLPRLRARGRRMLVIPRSLYQVSQRDSVSPLLAVALSAVEFLNEVTSGEDVDVGALASKEVLTLPLPELSAKDVPSASTFQMEAGNAFFVTVEGGTLDLAFPAPTTETPSTTGVGLLILPWYAQGWEGSAPPPSDLPRFTLRQGALAIESRRPVFVLPPSFDLTKPFRLRVAYAPGQTYLGGPLTLRQP